MSKKETYVLSFNKYEHGTLINSLNNMRTSLINENRHTDAVDDLILKVINTSPEKSRCKHETR